MALKVLIRYFNSTKVCVSDSKTRMNICSWNPGFMLTSQTEENSKGKKSNVALTQGRKHISPEKRKSSARTDSESDRKKCLSLGSKSEFKIMSCKQNRFLVFEERRCAVSVCACVVCACVCARRPAD